MTHHAHTSPRRFTLEVLRPLGPQEVPRHWVVPLHVHAIVGLHGGQASSSAASLIKRAPGCHCSLVAALSHASLSKGQLPELPTKPSGGTPDTGASDTRLQTLQTFQTPGGTSDTSDISDISDTRWHFRFQSKEGRPVQLARSVHQMTKRQLAYAHHCLKRLRCHPAARNGSTQYQSQAPAEVAGSSPRSACSYLGA